MILAYKMEYAGPENERPSVRMTRYTSVYQERYKKLYNDCYHEMREALDIKPYDFIQDDSFFKDEIRLGLIYLLLDNDKIIGSVTLRGREIDDLLVGREYQGLGYGRKILLWAIWAYQHIHIPPFRDDNMILHVADWNKRAIELYKSAGFVITETIEVG